GYMYFPKNVRFARTFDRPYLGMTARFHQSWADFGGLKPYPALEYETGQLVAHGARCSVGDQLHPRGALDRATHESIGKVYKRIECGWDESGAAGVGNQSPRDVAVSDDLHSLWEGDRSRRAAIGSCDV